MSDYTEQYPRGNTALYMDRADSIKFKLMPDGVIRGVQTQRPDHIKPLIADETIYGALQHALLR